MVYIYIYMYINIFVHSYACKFKHMHTYIYIYIYIYIYVYIYICRFMIEADASFGFLINKQNISLNREKTFPSAWSGIYICMYRYIVYI
jgi:hypothetical protein